MAWLRPRRALIAVMLGATLIGSAASTALATGPSVRGGGVLGGSPGATSQVAFTATELGGSFLCVMAGRSGGFPFPPWQSVQQMLVQGRVTPGSLKIGASGVATFDGIATVHVIGRDASGRPLAATVHDVGFTSTQAAGGAGVGWHQLDLPSLGVHIPVETLIAGRITISP